MLADGAIVIVTKETKNQAAQVYRIALDQLSAERRNAPPVLEKLESIDVAALLGRESGSLEAQVTGMSIAVGATGATAGVRFVLLTYASAIEFKLDLSRKSLPSTSQLKASEGYSILPITPLEQMEAIAYDKNDRDVLYTTERPPVLKRLFGVDGSVPIMAVTCERGKSK